MNLTILTGDWIDQLRTLPDQSVQCCVTSPPYWGLRDYGVNGQLGLEKTPEEYVAKIVAGFREVWRVLRDDGTLWVNLGDSYCAGGTGNQSNVGQRYGDGKESIGHTFRRDGKFAASIGLKPKDLVGIPWSVAKALQAPFYSGRIKNQLDRVWLAATLEAEGSICGFHHTRRDDGSLRTGVHICITNTNRLMLDNAFRIWPTSRSEHNNHGKGHFGKLDTWRWIAHDVNEKRELLRELYPYMVSKKKQCLLAFNFMELSCDAKSLGKSTEAESVKEKRSWIVHSLSKLNHLESVDIPSWCNEPPSLFEPGWYLRSDIIWHKINPMPESVTDRPTKSHEYIFLFSKKTKYFYDAEAIKEPVNGGAHARKANGANSRMVLERAAGKENSKPNPSRSHIPGVTPKSAAVGSRIKANESFHAAICDLVQDRNKRSVWSVAIASYSGAHFATFPPDLIKPCIMAGCPVGGTVLDPFFGSGTTGQVALELGRKCIGIELNPKYVELARQRCNITPGLQLA